jgi:hypothetical protein
MTLLGTMKRTVELDTGAICHRLHDLSGELRELARTANNLEGDEDLGDALVKIARAISAVGDEVITAPIT